MIQENGAKVCATHTHSTSETKSSFTFQMGQSSDNIENKPAVSPTFPASYSTVIPLMAYKGYSLGK